MNISRRIWMFSMCATFAMLIAVSASSHANDLLSGVPALPKNDVGPARELTGKFDGLAGSSRNADFLVRGLRTGKPIVLSSGETRTRFSPPTRPMGFGNINIALSLAQAELRGLGIRNPSPAQLQSALNGGVIITSKGATRLPGVLALRSGGKGWGQIAHQLGFKLGEVVRPTKAERVAREQRGNSKVADASHDREPGGKNHSFGIDRPHGGNHGGFSGHRGK